MSIKYKITCVLYLCMFFVSTSYLLHKTINPAASFAGHCKYSQNLSVIPKIKTLQCATYQPLRSASGTSSATIHLCLKMLGGYMQTCLLVSVNHFSSVESLGPGNQTG